MKLFLIRHGQTDWNKQGIIQGSTDIELNETGMKQAEETRKSLEGISFDCIFSSPLKRAQQTAEIIRQDDDLPLLCDDRLGERNFGKYEGTSVNQLNFTDFWDLGNTFSTNEEETAKAFFDRVHHFIDDILKLDYENVLIVAHGGVSLPFYSYFDTLEKQQDYLKYMLKNCEVACYDTNKIKEAIASK